MKCVCGYSDDPSPPAEQAQLQAQRQRPVPFVRFGLLTGLKLNDPPHRWEEETTPAFACPKCGTVRVEVGR